jgi:hypothetical protein
MTSWARFTDASGVQHGLVRESSTFIQIDFPGATSTQALSINDSREIVGSFTDAAGRTQGFIDVAGTFAQIDFSAGTNTNIFGINNRGENVGELFEMSGTS